MIFVNIDHNSEQYENNFAVQYISVLYMLQCQLHNIVHLCQYMSILPDIVHEIALVWFADAVLPMQGTQCLEHRDCVCASARARRGGATVAAHCDSLQWQSPPANTLLHLEPWVTAI